MRLLFIADGRSATALNWIAYFVEQDHEVHLASTYRCSPELKLAGLYFVPAAFSEAGSPAPGNSKFRKLAPIGLRTAIRQRLGPFTLPRSARRLRDIAAMINPDLVHAMRIPYEGMLAALADPHAPLLVSVWGNDFTLHAPATARMGRYTRQTLQRADALHADCQRDIHLAWNWSFPRDRPYVVLPGGGGIQLDQFSEPDASLDDSSPLGQTKSAQSVRPAFVINPRGFRAYVRNDVFFHAIPIVLAQRPEVRFSCPTMAGEAQAQAWVQELAIGDRVELLPRQTRPQMADLFRRAQVVVSASTHDGTPNTLLEAMACGCFPVAGDLESLREWITPGVNGLLIDPGDPQALAEAILLALDQPELRQRAAVHNRRLVEQRADYYQVMQEADRFYRSLIR
jgi:glycosyltransferase involved in cell wall biosynthesis